MKRFAWMLALVGFLGSLDSRASALVVKDDLRGVITLVTKINYTGPLATRAIAYAATAEISRMWNEPRAVVTYEGRPYRVEFLLGYAIPWAFNYDSGSCGENTVEIRNAGVGGDRSYYTLFGRYGVFFTSDEIGVSTTTAHEYGHGLGLDHDDYDQRTARVPGIMFARGTLVRPEFQWNPSSAPGAPGGSINPFYRHVRKSDVLKIALSRVLFRNGFGCLGEGLPIPVVLQNPVPVRFAAPAKQRLERGPSVTRSPEVESERDWDAHDH